MHVLRHTVGRMGFRRNAELGGGGEGVVRGGCGGWAFGRDLDIKVCVCVYVCVWWGGGLT